MPARLPDARRNAAVDSLVDALDAGSGPGTVQVRTGAQPADADDAATGTLLVTITLGDPAFGAASAGTATANASTAGTAVADGTAGWWRALDSDGNKVMDGEVGGDFQIDDTTITTSQSVNITAWTVSMPDTYDAADIAYGGTTGIAAANVEAALDEIAAERYIEGEDLTIGGMTIRSSDGRLKYTGSGFEIQGPGTEDTDATRIIDAGKDLYLQPGGNEIFFRSAAGATVMTMDLANGRFITNTGDHMWRFSGTDLYRVGAGQLGIKDSTDTQPRIRFDLTGPEVAFGPGGGTAVDTWLRRVAAATLTLEHTLRAKRAADTEPRVVIDGDNSRIWFGAGGSTAVDTSLRRVGVGEIRATNSFFTFERGGASFFTYGSFATGDTEYRFVMWTDGTLRWGGGVSAADLLAYRGGVGQLVIAPAAGINASEVLQLKAGDTSDHVRLALFPDSAAQTTRWAFLGVPSAGSNNVEFRVEQGKSMIIQTTGGGGISVASSNGTFALSDTEFSGVRASAASKFGAYAVTGDSINRFEFWPAGLGANLPSIKLGPGNAAMDVEFGRVAADMLGTPDRFRFGLLNAAVADADVANNTAAWYQDESTDRARLKAKDSAGAVHIAELPFGNVGVFAQSTAPAAPETNDVWVKTA